MIEFLDTLWPYAPMSNGETRFIKNGKVKQLFYRLAYRDNLEHLQADAQSMDADGWDCYFGVLPRLAKTGTADGVAEGGRVLWADLDTKSRPKAAAFDALGRVTVPPSIIVDSGYGYHAYWLLSNTPTWETARATMKGIALAVGGDNVSDKARVLRLPGTHNHKRDDHTDPLSQASAPVRLVKYDPINTAHPISDFIDYADMGRERPAVEHRAPTSPWDPEAHPIPDRLSQRMDEEPGKGFRSEFVYSVVCSLVELGLDDSEIEDRIRSHPQGVGVKYFEKGNLAHRWLKYTIDAARRHVGNQEDVIW